MRRRSFIGGVVGVGAGIGLGAAGGSAAAAGPDEGEPPGTVAPKPAGPARDWQAVPAPDGTPAAQLIGVAAAGADLAWAVGEEGRNGSTRGVPLGLVWDGGSWNRVDLGHLPFAGGFLHSVAVTSAGVAYAVGTSGGDRLLRWDGTTWQEIDFPGRGQTSTRLTGIAADSTGGIWLSGRGSDGSVLLYGDGSGNQSGWRWIPAPPSTVSLSESGVRVGPGGNVWVFAAEYVGRWDGVQWTELPAPGGIRASINDLLAVTDQDIWLVGHAYGVGGPPGKPPGVTLMHGDGTSWQYVTAPFSPGMLTAITADDQGGPDRIAGWDFWDQTRAHYLRRDGTAWVSERGPLSSTPVLTSSLVRVPGTADGYWAVGTTSSYPYPPAQIRIER
ncbi:hypothetical protein ACIQAC_03615 [Streptomyces sp. NPDC088387]|uniref:hypothetical protein n=1 Tax=Streptomyces sp. NPDC088387 TaxID=3365859 RepID=UPI00382A52AD